MFSQIQNLNWGKGEAIYRLMQQRYDEGVGHMQFVADLYEYQASEGRYFLHEHPWAATSWNLQCMQKVLGMPGVVEIRVDQCAYGQMSRDERGVGLALKPTRFATNAPLLARILEKRCSNHLKHVTIH